MHAASCTCARLVLEGAQDVEQHPPRRWQRQGGQQPHAVVARSQGGNLRGSLRVAGCQQRGGQGGSSSGLEDGVLQRACAARWVVLGARRGGSGSWRKPAGHGSPLPAPPPLPRPSGLCVPWGAPSVGGQRATDPRRAPRHDPLVPRLPAHLRRVLLGQGGHPLRPHAAGGARGQGGTPKHIGAQGGGGEGGHGAGRTR